MITIKQSGSFKNTTIFLNRLKKSNIRKILEPYGEKGVQALEEATPKRTGLTSRSWSYSIEIKKNTITLSWNNSNIQNGKNIALLIQYGFVMPSGYVVAGRDYINPTLRPIFDEIAESVYKEVSDNAYN